MSKIEILNKERKSKEGKDEENNGLENKPQKIETCYFCLKEFDMNKDELSYYKYGKFPMCGYCAQFYGFYSDEIKVKKE